MKYIFSIMLVLCTGCMPFSSQVAKDHIISITIRQKENATQWNLLVQQLALENKNTQLESNSILFAQGDAILQELESMGLPQENIEIRRAKLLEAYVTNNNHVEAEYNSTLKASEHLVQTNETLIQEMLSLIRIEANNVN